MPLTALRGGGGGHWSSVLAALLSLTCATPAIAGSPTTPSPQPFSVELKLPPDIVYSRTVSRDSAVVFSHETHVALAGNRCTGCHPQPFRMLTPTHRATHRQMNAGASCGVCHDGRRAFGVRDAASCASCHSGIATAPAGTNQAGLAAAAKGGAAASVPAARRLPKPFGYPRGESSPGTVTFRHETHARGKRTCSTCHPTPFAMAAVRSSPGIGAHERGACGACHDGTRVFGGDDAAACARCHAGSGGTP
jgi:c(7)-type cytochrome triheme protein